MGSYLNLETKGFGKASNSKIYVDKTGLIEKTNVALNTRQKFMVSAVRDVWKNRWRRICWPLTMLVERIRLNYLNRSKSEKAESYEKHRNQYDVIKANMQEFLSMTHSMDEMLSMLQKYLIFDPMDHFETVRFRDEHNLIQVMKDIYSKTNHSFIILIDEWDCLFREYKQDKEAQKKNIWISFVHG